MNEGIEIFPRGDKNPFGQYFSGQSYLSMLSTEGVVIGNVTFEPGCINNWHIHHANKGGGQILLVTSGRGYYQEWGKEPIELHSGDVVKFQLMSSIGTALLRIMCLFILRLRFRVKKQLMNGVNQLVMMITVILNRRRYENINSLFFV